MAQSAPTLGQWFAQNFGMVAAGLIALLFLVFGAADLLRLSPTRLWAISSVNFRESIRRKVLWVTPLAMLGVIAVTQLSHPVDEQDAIRQATKYCLFASGVVVVLTMLILGCTNLPREIDNRVIYTVVTKPATRLEIVLGKTVGFARTSGLILLIMGVFSYAYLSFNSEQLRSTAKVRLDHLAAGDVTRDTLQQYVTEGLLHAKTYGRPVNMQMYARLPKPGDECIWMFGGAEQEVLFPYNLPDKVFEAGRPEAHVMFTVEMKIEQRPLTQKEMDDHGYAGSTTQPTRPMPPPPHISAYLLGEDFTTLVPPKNLIDFTHMKDVKQGQEFKNTESVKLEPKPGDPARWQARILLDSKSIFETFRDVPSKNGHRRFYLLISGTTMATLYGVPKNSVLAELQLYDTAGQPLGQRPEALGARDESGTRVLTPAPIFRGKAGAARAQQMRGSTEAAQAPVTVYEFRNTRFSRGGSDTAPFEFRVRIQRSGEAGDTDESTHVQLVLKNAKTGFESPPIRVAPETDRPTFFRVPFKAVEGGDFDVLIRCTTEGHYVGLGGRSVAAVFATTSFAYNLLKSLLILWMLSVLVIIVAIFCSTFVSWPIAVILTLIMLLGRWMMLQVGEGVSPQSIVSGMFDAKTGGVEAKLFTEAMKGINAFVQTSVRVLPDISEFRVTEDIERGISIPNASLFAAVRVLGVFGVPLLALAYLFFKRKEVAP